MKDQRINVAVNKAIHDRLLKVSERKGFSLTWIVAEACERWLIVHEPLRPRKVAK